MDNRLTPKTTPIIAWFSHMGEASTVSTVILTNLLSIFRETAADMILQVNCNASYACPFLIRNAHVLAIDNN
ncbi:hypothetical protein [Sulfoacidibacillus ferrooxidans]|uniref:hypothetical protein n=1 Tax=Sulfoacidibacillus ferrooxidans TaxID=2005001 RepID=UPI001F514876|nr:hypothetical protein [Sulfoacidibacillus ferrooxidans]